MDTERLRYMAEQIAREFKAQGDDKAVAATAEHIRLYWDPRMKAALKADDSSALSPIVAAALQQV
jgi:formate dehydrogenase subunit delta